MSYSAANAAIRARETQGLQLPRELRGVMATLFATPFQVVGETISFAGIRACCAFRELPRQDVPSHGFPIDAQTPGNFAVGYSLAMQLVIGAQLGPTQGCEMFCDIGA